MMFNAHLNFLFTITHVFQGINGRYSQGDSNIKAIDFGQKIFRVIIASSENAVLVNQLKVFSLFPKYIKMIQSRGFVALQTIKYETVFCLIFDD